LVKKSVSKGIIKDIIIVGVGVLIIWFSLQFVFGTENPFYVVASGSMIPVLEVYDVLIVEGHTPFEDIEIGEIIVFNRPSDHDRVIVHRVVSIINDDPISLRTQGDANPKSIPGTDFPITQEEYIGKVEYTIPQIGYVTQLLKPPVNYIIIIVVIGIMVVKQIVNKKNEKETTLSNSFDLENQDPVEELSDIDKIEKDSEYSEHIEKSETTEDKKIDSDESTKTDEKTSEKDKEE